MCGGHKRSQVGKTHSSINYLRSIQLTNDKWEYHGFALHIPLSHILFSPSIQMSFISPSPPLLFRGVQWPVG